MKKKKSKTSDAIAILENRYVKNRPARLRTLAQMESALDVARQLYDLRTNAGLSQRALARHIGTSASVICQLEDAEYRGHSLRMLQRLANALKQRVVITFEPLTQHS
jgi:ribosome-binding protein aMBF1 (putative translation factor)